MIPHENEKDLEEIPENVKESIKIIPVSHVSEVIKHSLTRTPEKIEWDESAEEAAASQLTSEDNQTATAH